MMWIEFLYIAILLVVLWSQLRLEQKFEKIRAEIRQIGSMAARIEGKDLEIRLREKHGL